MPVVQRMCSGEKRRICSILFSEKERCPLTRAASEADLLRSGRQLPTVSRRLACLSVSPVQHCRRETLAAWPCSPCELSISTVPAMSTHPSEIPSPLPFVVSILPLLLSTSNDGLPPATLSDSVLQRHYYLSASPSSPATYFQASSDSSVQDAVESRREALASTWLEDVKLSSSSEIQYSKTVHEEHKLVARIQLSKSQTSSAYDSASDSSLVLLVVYEEANPPDAAGGSDAPSGGNSTSAAGPSSKRDEQQQSEEEVAGWRYYDLQLPNSRSNLNKSAWHNTMSEAEAALAGLLPSTSTTETRTNRSNSTSTGKQKETPAQKALREKQREEDAARGLQVEEGPDQDPDDYWAGCESSDDEGAKDNHEAPEMEEDNEDDYWNNYGAGSPGNEGGSIIDSGHHESERPLDDEDYTARFQQHDKSDTLQHLEYAEGSHHHVEDDGFMQPQEQDYSFEQHPRQNPAQGSRLLIDSFQQDQNGMTDSFLATLQSSLERVSSSQSSASSHPEDQPEEIHLDGQQGNGYMMNGNGHTNHEHERAQSPTIDSAISKSIAGLWETYLLSSALGGGGKSREIAAYEFMELVQNVINGES